jgi:hypothetical protein
MYRRIAVLASLAVMAAMFVGSSTANAALGDGGVCVFDGLAGGLTPAIQDTVNDVTGGNPLSIERGGYTFNGDATCVGTVGGTVFAPTAGPDNVDLSSVGNYDNIVCGTGTAHDHDGDLTSVTAVSGTGVGASIRNVGYEIPFVGGNGPLLIGLGTNISGAVHDLGAVTGHEGPAHAHAPTSGNFAGVGAVHITPGDRRDPVAPADSDNCIADNGDGDGGTNTFEVAGAFIAAGKP